MAEKGTTNTFLEAGFSFFNKLWDWTDTSETWRVILFSAIIIILILIALTAFFHAMGKALEGGLKLIEMYKTSGLPRLMKREQRIKIRRRSQFCAVLEADLANISKAESWNDQYFTDLEAEVETEGGYYLSLRHRLQGKVSIGLRKEKSLIKAISSSSERAILLIGEPGSGKSVALRHLASQLAEQAKISKDKNTLVPLYVNLREIAVPPNVPITADAIRDFILENIRRGDSDTTAYVRENWDDYRERGIWFFLFDSFDEIPAVLHAEKGSPATRDYSQAIRMFLEGMGNCRGILASREYKGPESLPWTKFRILRLTASKQRELVANAFLSATQQRAVLHHLATNESSLANTPLFLTLLCRYVKEASQAPKNDYELLSLQIDRLARRDPFYLLKTYNLKPAELLEGAQIIARLFAEEPSLGLAPTLDQVEAVLDGNHIPGGNIQRFVAAMVDSKIARADVANAAPGDRRFAFAHRRYQEALFVRHLVSHPGYLSGYDLLTEPRWREYAVTLLETQPAPALAEMFDAAVDMISEATTSQNRRNSDDPLSGYCGYFEWTSDATQILLLMQEGLARRVATIPAALSKAIEEFLDPRWETGDSFDRIGVMRVAALLPQATLNRYIEEIFLSGSDKAQNESFNQTASLTEPVPEAVRQAALKRLASEILAAKDISALMRVEALVARLPKEIGADYVLRRCRLLWRFTNLVIPLISFTLPIGIIGAFFSRSPHRNGAHRVISSRTHLALFFGGTVAIYLPVLLAAILGTKKLAQDAPPHVFEVMLKLQAGDIALGIVGFAISALIGYSLLPLIFVFRAVGEPLSVKFFFRRYGKKKSIIRAVKLCFSMLLMFFIFGAATYGIGFGLSFSVNHLFGYRIPFPEFILGMSIIFTVILGFIFFTWMAGIRQRNASLRALRNKISENPGDPIRVMLSARDWKQLNIWLSSSNSNFAPSIKVDNNEKVRSLSAALQHIQRGEVLPEAISKVMAVEPRTHVLSDCINSVEQMHDLFARGLQPDEKRIGTDNAAVSMSM